MTERPADIPAAVREAFAGHRVGSAWNLVVSAHPNERLAALLGFERLMAAKGLGLADVAVAIAALPEPVAVAAPRRDPDDPSIDWSVFAGFGGSFSKEDARRAPTPPARPATPAPRTRIELRGPAVPETVIGRIRIEERRPTRSDGEMLVFVAETEDRTYGPMAAYAGPQIAHLVEAERSNWIIRLMIERTHSDRILPKVRRLETV
jgi:hypothetical protein